MQEPKKVGIGGIIVLIIGGLVIVGWISSAFSGSDASATSTPSGSLAARTIPMNQLTGADWLTMSFAERGTVIDAATKQIHCPSAVTKNDLTIGVTQAAQTTAGQSQRVVDLLAALFVLDGCVTG